MSDQRRRHRWSGQSRSFSAAALCWRQPRALVNWRRLAPLSTVNEDWLCPHTLPHATQARSCSHRLGHGSNGLPASTTGRLRLTRSPAASPCPHVPSSPIAVVASSIIPYVSVHARSYSNTAVSSGRTAAVALPGGRHVIAGVA